MQIATFVVAVAGVMLSALSLGWQGANYLLTGRRVKIELRWGATGRGGLVTSANAIDAGWMAHLAEQGYTEPVIAVRVRNVGRIPVTVTSWGLACTPKGLTFSPVGMTLGKPLPHRLEAGETEIWAVRAEVIRPLVVTTAETFNIPASRITIRGEVELGDGRTCTTRQQISGNGI